MDLHILFSIVSAMYAVLSTVMSSPASETPSAVAPARHVRNKRCSCATFLDKECVYFCHLDIIWVNTPARIVSYGLGNAPRMRRAIRDFVTNEGPRCTCLRENDTTCTSFCQLEKHHREKTQCKHKLAAKAGRIRMNHGAGRVASIKAHLLQKWRAKRHHRARAWEGESAAT